LVNAVFASAAAVSPAPFAVMNDWICALVWAAGCAAASGMYRLTARSSRAITLIVTGSLRTLPPGGITTLDAPSKNTRVFDPATRAYESARALSSTCRAGVLPAGSVRGRSRDREPDRALAAADQQLGRAVLQRRDGAGRLQRPRGDRVASAVGGRRVAQVPLH